MSLYRHTLLLMARKLDSDRQIGRRLRLRDLHLFSEVVQHGSMAKAASHLGISQPAVSEVIADLERSVGVRLLDRSPRGVEPTAYGQALLKRSLAAFDELKQGVRDIEFLSDPTSGELRIGCSVSLAATILPPVIRRFSMQYPGAVLHVDEVPPPSREQPVLRSRQYDFILSRLMEPLSDDPLGDDLNVEFLFDDPLVVAAGNQSRWARRRKIDLKELVDERWILTPADSWNHLRMAEAFRARGLEMPKISLLTRSVLLRARLLADGGLVTAVAKSIADQYGMSVLPVDLPVRSWPVVAVTLKNRTLSPVVERFLEHLREFTRSMLTHER
jgi:DNA-binding transcriptional LysR family regulator